MRAGAIKFAGIVAAAASLATVPTLAFAEEAGKGNLQAILPDMLEFIPMLVAFIVLAIVLKVAAWPQITGILNAREEAVREALKKSEEAQAEAERTLAEYKKELADAKAQAAQIIADAKTTAEAVKADIEAKAEAEREAMVEKAKASIEAEKKAAVAELQGAMVDISMSVAERLVGESLSDDEHRKIIERYVNEAGNLNA